MAKKKMLKKIKHKYRSGNCRLELDLSRFEKQFQDAQKTLGSMAMTSMLPYMPKDTVVFIDTTKGMSDALAGSGKVVAAAPPFGRFLYEGKVMVDEKTGSPWAGKGAKKVVTDRPLNYNKSANPEVTDHWFDTAKKNHCEGWVRAVKRTAGGG